MSVWEEEYCIWTLPNGHEIEARVYESYTGLRSQKRLGLVDRQGRVHHYDFDKLEARVIDPLFIDEAHL